MAEISRADSFPPNSSRQEEIDQFVAVLSSVVDGRTATYLSAPFSSGRRLFELYRAVRIDPTLSNAGKNRSEVVHRNRAYARELARRLRGRGICVLIDPSGFDDVPDWDQNDYRHFWRRVLEVYVATVVFSTDWEFSNGCAYEFLVATRSGLTMLREDLSPLELGEGVARLRAAICEAKEVGAPTEFLESVLAELERGVYG